jgi:NAD(P)H-dependent FMN reductase
MTKILVFASSTRSGSYNQQLANLAMQVLNAHKAEITKISLKDYEMPLYNGDFENSAGIPQKAKDLVKLFDAQQGIFIASPEYNSSFTPLLKNTLDWMSRVKDGIMPFGKVFALGGASPGSFGGYRAMTQLRQCLEHGFNALVIPEMISIKNAHEAFRDDGSLKDENLTKQLERCIKALLDRTAALG